jgi:hypothetical protein
MTLSGVDGAPPELRTRLPMLAMLVLALGVMLLCAACEEKKQSPEAPLADGSAGTDKYAAADPKLAKALQATSATSDNGPPPDGIFPPGGVDQRHPKGAPTKVDFVVDGSEPRVSLLAGADASPDLARAASYGPASIELAIQMGPRMAMPTIDLGIVLGPGRKDDGGPDWLVADVKKAFPAKQQMGQLPPGADKEIGTLDGTSIRIKITPDGRESAIDMQLAKTAHPDLERLAMNAAEALVFATVPLPDRPVGVGALWIAETRMPLSGLDVVAYRAYRVKEIDGDRLRLTLDVKAYAASKDVQLAGVPKGATLEQFDAQSGGELELVRGELLARKSTMQQRVVMVFQGTGATQTPPPPGQPPGNVLTAQLQSQATMVRGDDLRAAARQP